MRLSSSLATEIKSYIMNLLGKEVVIVEVDGTIISSPKEEELGTKISLPKNVSDYTEPTTIKQSNRSSVIIPLEHDHKIVAGLILHEKYEDIQNFILLIKSFADLLIQQWFENNKPVLDTTDQFMTKLLHSAGPADYPMYELEAQVLGYDLQVRRLAIVVNLKGFWEKCLIALDEPTFEREQIIKDWKQSIEKEINGFFTRNTDNIVAYIGNDKFVIFKSVEAANEENTIKLLKKSHKAIFEPLNKFQISSITVGFGNASQGVKGLIDSYREADIALEFGARMWGENRSYFFGDLGILSIIADGNRDKKMQFAQNLLGRLNSSDLTKTLECFFDNNLNLTETANSMHIHRNTVIYRLNQIADTLDADPRIFEQAMTIKTALLIRSLLG